MSELFQMGGVLFMSVLTLLFIAVLIAAFRYWTVSESTKKDHDMIKSLGLLALVVGILGQLIGLFSAFQTIEQIGSVSPDILAGGLKVSMIPTMYGAIIYIIALLIWMVMGKVVIRNSDK